MLQFYDTKKRSFVRPRFPSDVRMYVCGITPYDSAHLGHAFTFLTYDILQRYLEKKGHEVEIVRNITDVDEPIYKKADELGIDYRALAEEETEKFQETMQKLDIKTPFAEPRASQYIEKIADAVKQLLENGTAYKLGNGDIYFDVSKAENFGENSQFSHALQLAFSADRGGDPERNDKRNRLDFLLWKAKDGDKKNDPAWETSLGMGRPGWHIECSVMSSDLLGTPFDIHGGGMDLIFPHHEAENAQSQALGSEMFARNWLHVAPLLYHGEKMSKSLGNLVFAADLLQNHEPSVVRLALLSYHYRVGGEWIDETLENAKMQLQEIRNALAVGTGPNPEPFLNEFYQALENDLDTPRAVRLLENFAVLCAKNGGDYEIQPAVQDMAQLLGISLENSVVPSQN